MKYELPLRFVQVALAREQLREAESLITELGTVYRKPGTKMRNRIESWLRKVPEVLDGLPQTFEVGQLVTYKDKDGHRPIDGIIVATVTCHEQYVCGPGELRDKNPGPLFMLHAHHIAKRGEPLPILQEITE